MGGEPDARQCLRGLLDERVQKLAFSFTELADFLKTQAQHAPQFVLQHEGKGGETSRGLGAYAHRTGIDLIERAPAHEHRGSPYGGVTRRNPKRQREALEPGAEFRRVAHLVEEVEMLPILRGCDEGAHIRAGGGDRFADQEFHDVFGPDDLGKRHGEPL